MSNPIRNTARLLKYHINAFRTSLRKRQKVFVIGFNKTGTTSVHEAMRELDMIVGQQRRAELLMKDVVNGKYDSLINYCKSAEAFQDVPFSKPGIFKVVDKAFPGSKFVLTVRDSPEQWFNSILKFQSKMKGDGNIPTLDDYKNDTYVYKGWAYMVHTWTYGTDLFNEEKYKQVYQQHIDDVKAYFKDRPDDLLVINVAKPESYKQFCAFTGQTPKRASFDWKNKTSEIR